MFEKLSKLVKRKENFESEIENVKKHVLYDCVKPGSGSESVSALRYNASYSMTDLDFRSVIQ
jgi:hypothetical protein